MGSRSGGASRAGRAMDLGRAMEIAGKTTLVRSGAPLRDLKLAETVLRRHIAGLEKELDQLKSRGASNQDIENAQSEIDFFNVSLYPIVDRISREEAEE